MLENILHSMQVHVRTKGFGMSDPQPCMEHQRKEKGYTSEI